MVSILINVISIQNFISCIKNQALLHYSVGELRASSKISDSNSLLTLADLVASASRASVESPSAHSPETTSKNDICLSPLLTSSPRCSDQSLSPISNLGHYSDGSPSPQYTDEIPRNSFKEIDSSHLYTPRPQHHIHDARYTSLSDGSGDLRSSGRRSGPYLPTPRSTPHASTSKMQQILENSSEISYARSTGNENKMSLGYLLS
jgi:hypothetical protein